MKSLSKVHKGQHSTG